MVEAEKANYTSFAEALDTFLYFDYGKLVANQPQFVVNLGRSFREDLVGRDGLTASIKYETGQANVNGLRRRCPDLAITCYQQFVKDQNNALKKNWRASFKGSYTWTENFDYTSPDGTVLLALDESEAWNISLSAGRSLRLDKQHQEVSRFDVEAVYEDVTGDTTKQARFVANATVTQKVSDQFSMSFGVVYANRPEYRGDVDEELSARAGLKIKLSRPDEE